MIAFNRAIVLSLQRGNDRIQQSYCAIVTARQWSHSTELLCYRCSEAMIAFNRAIVLSLQRGNDRIQQSYCAIVAARQWSHSTELLCYRYRRQWSHSTKLFCYRYSEAMIAFNRAIVLSLQRGNDRIQQSYCAIVAARQWSHSTKLFCYRYSEAMIAFNRAIVLSLQRGNDRIQQSYCAIVNSEATFTRAIVLLLTARQWLHSTKLLCSRYSEAFNRCIFL